MPTGPEFGEIWEGFGINHAVSISVRDDAALLDAPSAPEIGAPYGIPAPVGPFLKEVGAAPGRLRIAFFTKGASNQTHPECIAAVKDAAELCEGLGHRVEEASPAIAYAPLLQAFQLVVRAHTASLLNLIGQMQGRQVTADMVEPQTWQLARAGRKASAADLSGAKSLFNTATRTVASFLRSYDVILTPTLGEPPRELGYFDTVNLPLDVLGERVFHFIPFTWLHNVTGCPAMSVPLYWNDDGLPVGVQFAGRYADEATLYRPGETIGGDPSLEKQSSRNRHVTSVLSGKSASLIRDGFSSSVRRATQEYREFFEVAEQSCRRKDARSSGVNFPDSTLGHGHNPRTCSDHGGSSHSLCSDPSQRGT